MPAPNKTNHPNKPKKPKPDRVTKRLAKAVLQSILLEKILAAVIALWLRFCFVTSRWELSGIEVMESARDAGKPLLFALWHNRIIMMVFLWRRVHKKPRLGVIISGHRDGLLIARAVAWLGIRPIKGSSKRGGSVALLEVVRALQRGESIAITPDGPKGPPFVVKPGILGAAYRAGVPIVPVAYAMSRQIRLKSWDRLVIPRPFSRAIFVIGEPLPVTATTDSAGGEALRLELQRRLMAVTERANHAVGKSGEK
ncbi:MAG: lysophospholipid acyltransferase family protein [Candidatus Symbiobacter sp.]|nr:lysophospholipid acyltransferase family protein [Candidatus Symbiobacter sp.]